MALTQEELNQIEEAEPIDLQGLEFSSDPGPAEMQGVDRGKMSAKFTLCTTRPNRQGNQHVLQETEQGKGMILTEHQKNPVVLFEHGFGNLKFPAIGQSKDADGNYTVKLMATKVTGTVFFSQSNPDAQVVFGMVDEGILHMASVGFDAIKGVRMKQKSPPRLSEGVESLEWQRRGMIFTETVLKEWSIVASGADLGAMAQALEVGKFNGEKFTDEMRSWLQSLVPETPRSWTGWAPEDDDTEADPDWGHLKVEIGQGAGIVKIEGPSVAVQSLAEAIREKSHVDTIAQAVETPHPEAAASPQAVPDLAEAFQQSEAARNQPGLSQALQDTITAGLASLLDERLQPIMENQKALQNKFASMTGK